MQNNLEYSYTNPIKLTQQFRFCGNPLSCDLYKNCSFQCNYCFAKTHIVNIENKKIELADIKIIERLFKKAFETNEPTKDVVVELLRHKTPIHCGGMSDPFQPIEFKLHQTYKLIELSNKYDVPICFSTKQCYLPEEYYKILNPELHAFQISLISDDAEWLKKYEPNVASPQQRLAFMQTLKQKGFWVAMRVQPLIDVDHALNVMLKAQEIVDYIVIEHLKIAINDKHQHELFKEQLNQYCVNGNSRYFEKPYLLKLKDILYLQSKVKKCKIGVGDNDLHHLSQSRCCCGIDTIGGKFDNYLKYNLTYFTTGNITEQEANSLYVPECSCAGCFMSDQQIKGVDNFKDFVDKYCAKNINLIPNGNNLKNKYINYFLNSENIRKFQKNESKKGTNVFDLL